MNAAMALIHVIEMLPVPTHKDLIHVPATMVTLGMDSPVLVSTYKYSFMVELT